MIRSRLLLAELGYLFILKKNRCLHDDVKKNNSRMVEHFDEVNQNEMDNGVDRKIF